MEKLATQDAQVISERSPSVISLLHTQPHRFDFYQAVRVLEACAPGRSLLGGGSHDVLQIRSHVTLSPVGTDIQHLTPGRFPQEPTTLTVNFLSIAGIHGPLPTPYTEMLLDQKRRQRTGMQDFLDIFNHRLAALWYQSRVALCPGVAWKRPEHTTAGKIVFDLVGLNTQRHTSDEVCEKSAPLTFPALFWSQKRSASDLVRIIQNVFQVPAVRLVSNQGRWMEGDLAEATRLGRAFHRLGQETILGTRSWSQSYGIRLHLLNLTWAQYQALLPGGSQIDNLLALVCRYTRLNPQAIQIKLGLAANATPHLPLGGMRLGRSAWIYTQYK